MKRAHDLVSHKASEAVQRACCPSNVISCLPFMHVACSCMSCSCPSCPQRPKLQGFSLAAWLGSGPSAESRSSPGSSWLTPAASAGASWLQPPVTVEPKAKVPRSSSPLEVCSQQQAASGRAPSWLTPSPAGCSRPARMPAKPMPEVHLTLGMSFWLASPVRPPHCLWQKPGRLQQAC